MHSAREVFESLSNRIFQDAFTDSDSESQDESTSFDFEEENEWQPPKKRDPAFGSGKREPKTSSRSEERFTMADERTFIAVKPDGVQRGIIGDIVKRFEQRGYKLVAAKLCRPGKAHLEKHYAELSAKPFFPALVAYMTSGPVFAMVWEGKEVVKMGRAMLGATDPLASNPGTVRGDFAIDKGRNVCHGSDSVASAKKEIELWFNKDELISYEAHLEPWVYE